MPRPRKKTILEELDALEVENKKKDADELLTEKDEPEPEVDESDVTEDDDETESDVTEDDDETESDVTEDDDEVDESVEMDDEDNVEMDDEDLDADLDDENDDAIVEISSKLDDIIASINDLKDSLSEEGEEELEDIEEDLDDIKDDEKNEVDTLEGEEEYLAKEDFSPIFDNSENLVLTEDLKKKANIVFNTVLTEKVNEITKKIAEKSEKAVNQKVKKLMETVLNDVNDYFEYLAEQWMQENKLAVEQGIRNNLVENVLHKFKVALADSHIDLPDEDLTLVEELNMKTRELRKQVDEVLTENIKLKKSLITSQKTAIQNTLTEGLSALDAEKFRRLAKTIDFENSEQYGKDLKVLAETVSKKPSSKPTVHAKKALTENVDVGFIDITGINPSMTFSDVERPNTETPIDEYLTSLNRLIR